MVDKNMVVYLVSNSTSESIIIQNQIEGIQKMIKPYEGKEEEEEEPTKAVIEISLAAKRHWELQIKTLQDSPRDPDKLREILKAKQKEYDKAEDSEDIERLVTEIETLKFVLFLVCRNETKEE